MSNEEKFRKKRAEEIFRLANVLAKSTITCDVQPLNTAASKCRNWTPTTIGCWGYTVDGVIFRDPEPQTRIRPEGAIITAVQLNVTLMGRCIEQDNGDPLVRLGIEMLLQGEGSDRKPLQSAWYMDRHEPDDHLKLPVHPTYHFQFGGMRIKHLNCGELILPAPPRLAHPPLDVVLAVDFVLSNYFSNEWVKLREESEYFRLVRQAQRRFWWPYVQATSNGWDNTPRADSWHVYHVWPQMILDE